MVLFYYPNGPASLVFWDPIRNIRTYIKKPPCGWTDTYKNATVLYSTNHGCHSSNFWIVLISTSMQFKAFVKRYSSELGGWEDLINHTQMMEHVDNMPATLIGDILYWPTKYRYIIAFNNITMRLSYVKVLHTTDDIFRRNLYIVKMHGGGVGRAVIIGFTLQMWSSARSSAGDYDWTPHSNVNLAAILALDTSFPCHGKHVLRLLCAFEDRDMVIVWAKEGVFQLDVSNMR